MWTVLKDGSGISSPFNSVQSQINVALIIIPKNRAKVGNGKCAQFSDLIVGSEISSHVQGRSVYCALV